MKVAVIGAGYVGLVMAVGFAEVGHEVVCAELNDDKRLKLNAGESPIHEKGLSEALKVCLQNSLISFVKTTSEALPGSHVVFIAVGTPSLDTGESDISNIFAVAEEIAQTAINPFVLVVKSTVPVGTSLKVEKLINATLKERGFGFEIPVFSNPEFLKEGKALDDFRRPDRVVIGSEGDNGLQLLKELYAPFIRDVSELVLVGRESAELGKYAANCMLAARISFMNEFSAIAEATSADIDDVRLILGTDPRIGSDFLRAGVGFGGSCFPKDLRAISFMGKEFGIATEILDAVTSVNNRQKISVANKIKRELTTLGNRTCAIWGLAFKPETDDIREAPAIDLINFLILNGAIVRVYDPIVKTSNLEFGPSFTYCDDKYEVTDGADVLILMTEWEEFQYPDFAILSEKMNNKFIIDGRNIWDKEEIEALGFTYQGIGR